MLGWYHAFEKIGVPQAFLRCRVLPKWSVEAGERTQSKIRCQRREAIMLKLAYRASGSRSSYVDSGADNQRSACAAVIIRAPIGRCMVLVTSAALFARSASVRLNVVRRRMHARVRQSRSQRDCRIRRGLYLAPDRLPHSGQERPQKLRSK